MIKVNYLLKDRKLVELEITGHAEYDESGKDIVCAAVSTAIIVTANAVELLDLNSKRELMIDEGYFKFTVLEHEHVLDKLLENLEYTLYDLEKQ